MATRPRAPPTSGRSTARRSPPTSARVRGQSNVIGVVLIIGMVVASATLIALSGASIMDQYRELAGQESTTNAVEEIDTELSSVASVGGLTRAEFSIGDARPSQYRIVHKGYINVTANHDPACRAHIPLSSLRYERDDGVTIAYEAGGIWRQENGVVEQTVMHTPPDLTFSDGTLSLTVVNLTGSIDGAENVVSEDVSGSITRNQALQDALFTDECARPNNVTITVKSDFYRGWSRYLHTAINGSSYDTYPNGTTRVVLDQDRLPQETDDSVNDVVDLTSSAFQPVTVTNTSIEVDKDANNTYTAIVTPLSKSSTQVGEIRVVEGDAAYRPPIDVVFVVDESGSMDWEADGDSDRDWCYEPNPSCVSKRDKAQEAAKAFVGQMNASYDRAGVVGFDASGDIKVTTNGEYLTNDFGSGGVNGSIDDLTASGGTNIAAGLHEGNVMIGLTSNSSRNKVMILLGDGENSNSGDDQLSLDEAEQADKEGITIHTIGFGAADEQLLRDIAETTGGTYRYVEDANDLSSVFVELFAEISESKQVVLDPFSMRLRAGGTTFYPQIDGDTGHIAKNESGPELNLNDPTAPSNFSYSIDISDGENVTMSAVDYDCLEWEATGQVYENTTNGQEYAEVRCVDFDGSSGTEIPASSMRVYVDGDDASSLLSAPPNWWNADLKNETLDGYLDGPNNETIDLESNQAIVVFEFPDGDGGTDRLLALYRIGQSREEAIPRHIFNLEVRELVVGQDA